MAKKKYLPYYTAFLMVFFCLISSCDNKDECSEGLLKCTDGKCRECCQDEDCDSGEICNLDLDGKCESEPCREGDDCSLDSSCCAENLSCDIFSATCMTDCQTDADCLARTEIPFNQDLKCSNGICDFEHCRTDDDCPGGSVCYQADCVTPRYDCLELDHCRIVPGYATTHEGTTVQLFASAYLKSGALAPGMAFEWSSNATDVVQVDDNGLVTGGTLAGSADVAAKTVGCPTSCQSAVVNQRVNSFGTRVMVEEELEGYPIEGAAVVVGAQTATTDEFGVATFSDELSIANPQDITVSKKDFNYVTLRQVTRDDVIVFLGKLYDQDFSQVPPVEVAGGITGEFDPVMIPCDQSVNCDFVMGLAGLSIPGNLLNLNVDSIMGRLVDMEMRINGTIESIPMPGDMIMYPHDGFEEFRAVGVPEIRSAWGMATRYISAEDLVDMYSAVISSDEVDIGKLYETVISMLDSSYTAVVPDVEIMPIPKVVDAQDIDQDGDTTELVPDYDNFLTLNIVPRLPMQQTMTLVAPDFPEKPGGGWYYDAIFVIAGVIVRGDGMIPLGLAFVQDSQSPDDQPNGKIEDNIEIMASDIAGQIPEGQLDRVIVALALNTSNLSSDSEDVEIRAGQVLHVSEFSGTHTLNDFLPPAEAAYDSGARHLEVASLPSGTDYCQAVFTGSNDEKWQVSGEWVTGGYDIPTAPASGDRSEGASLFCIKLADSIGYQDLVEFNDTSMGNLVDLISGFSYTEVR